MLKRKIISQIEKWKNNHSHEALLIKGARQVGKTTIIREFGRIHYDNIVEINFERDTNAKNAFEGKKDTKTIVSNLSLLGYGPFDKHRTLIFLDEIQSCPDARTAIKFLVEDDCFDIIESGSLLGINYADVSSYPVGYESQLEMFPLDFEEWLWANGIDENIISELHSQYLTGLQTDDFVHNQMMRLYREFLIVGGMPKVVTTYLSNPDFSETFRQQKLLIDSYRLDISKYALDQKTRAKRFFDAIPSELSKQHKRFVLKDLEVSGNMQKYSDAAWWLKDAGVAIFCFNTHSLCVPFEQYENMNLFKVYLLDTGLLCAMWGNDIQKHIINGEISINEGAVTENFVACELIKHGYSIHYYDQKSRNELDFLIREGRQTTIIEVKSGNDFRRHTALDNVISTQSEFIERSIVLSKSKPEKTDDVLYLPLYMAMFI